MPDNVVRYPRYRFPSRLSATLFDSSHPKNGHNNVNLLTASH